MSIFPQRSTYGKHIPTVECRFLFIFIKVFLFFIIITLFYNFRSYSSIARRSVKYFSMASESSVLP